MANRSDEIENQQEAIVILEQSPFYAESGGQVGDIGVLTNANTEFQVRDTQKQNDVFMHIGAIHRGKLTVGDTD